VRDEAERIAKEAMIKKLDEERQKKGVEARDTTQPMDIDIETSMERTLSTQTLFTG
jgi:hypothetical protein